MFEDHGSKGESVEHVDELIVLHVIVSGQLQLSHKGILEMSTLTDLWAESQWFFKLNQELSEFVCGNEGSSIRVEFSPSLPK